MKLNRKDNKWNLFSVLSFQLADRNLALERAKRWCNILQIEGSDSRVFIIIKIFLSFLKFYTINHLLNWCTNPKQWLRKTLSTYSFQDDVADVKTNRTERVRKREKRRRNLSWHWQWWNKNLITWQDTRWLLLSFVFCFHPRLLLLL